MDTTTRTATTSAIPEAMEPTLAEMPGERMEGGNVASLSPVPVKRSAILESAAVIVWAAIVIALLAYLCFGSIVARMWKLDTFQNAWVEDHSPRRIAHIWKYQFDHLPAFAGPTAMQVLFGGAVVVMLVGSAMCLWLMLAEVRNGGSQPE